MSWNRKTDDPLIRLFLDKYGLHLLANPRENVAVGDLYVYDGKKVSIPGRITDLYDPPLELPDIVKNEHLTDIAGAETNAVSINLGFKLLDKFLNAFGAIGLGSKVRSSYRANKTKVVKFKFANATRDYITSVLRLGATIFKRELMEGLPLLEKENNFYLVSGVVRTSSISVIAEDEQKKVVNTELIVSQLADLSSEVSVEQKELGETIFFGKTKKMAFGVELHELQYNPVTNKMTLKMPPLGHVPVRSKKSPRSIPPAFIGDIEDDVFLTVNESHEL